MVAGVGAHVLGRQWGWVRDPWTELGPIALETQRIYTALGREPLRARAVRCKLNQYDYKVRVQRTYLRVAVAVVPRRRFERNNGPMRNESR